MAASRDPIRQVEGQWEELLRHPDQFAGRRVRVTVLGDEHQGASSLLAEIRRWLAEGKSLQISPPAHVRANAFEDGVAEKFRRQGLVL